MRILFHRDGDGPDARLLVAQGQGQVLMRRGTPRVRGKDDFRPFHVLEEHETADAEQPQQGREDDHDGKILSCLLILSSEKPP